MLEEQLRQGAGRPRGDPTRPHPPGPIKARKIDPHEGDAGPLREGHPVGQVVPGPSFQRDIILAVAATLNDEAGYEKLGLEYARRGEKALDPKEPPAAQKRVLDVLVAALEKNKREEEVKTVQARLAKLDFRIKPKMFSGRTAKSDRVVLVPNCSRGELCPPCVSADLAVRRGLAQVRTSRPRSFCCNTTCTSPAPTR